MAGKQFVTCMKGLFMVFNFVFWLTGVALLVVGVLVKTSLGAFMHLSSNINYNIAPYIMIGCGVFIILIGFCGCWASIKEHGWALRVYMAILLILFVCEVAGAIAGYVMRGKMADGLEEGLKNAIRDYYKSGEESIKKAMDDVQQKGFKCCGVKNYSDWFASSAGNNTVPKSCCRPDVKCFYDDLDKAAKGDAGIFTKGCYDSMLDEAKKNFKIVGGVALGIAVFQLLGVACAFVLTKAFSDSTSYEQM